MTQEAVDFTTVLFCDNAVLRTGLESVLSGSPFVLTSTVLAASLKLADKVTEQPALAIVAGNQFSGRIVEFIRQARAQFPQARIVVLVSQFDSNGVWSVLEAGADGLCRTGMSREALITSLELVMLGESMLPVALVGTMLSEQPSSLTPEAQRLGTNRSLLSNPGGRKISHREAEILRCLTQGEANKVIARKLDITEATIKVHIKAILRKIGVANRTQAAMWATAHLPASVDAAMRI
jgi:two-component system nitrate/nitrite response regulator NarL